MKTKPKKNKSFISSITPQQQIFLQHYLNVKSETFNNALQSALRAGYSQEYAENITHLMPDWLSERIGDNEMLEKAVDNLNDFLGMDVEEPVIGAFGPLKDRKTGYLIMRDNVGKMKLKLDTSKFVAERLGRKRFGQEKATTVVPIQINIDKAREKYA